MAFTQRLKHLAARLGQASCRSCHRDGPRRDEEFMRDWGGSDLESLFKQIKVSMPAGAPSSLSDAAYADIVAYVLQANAFPAGSTELAPAAIGPIRIEGRSGPAPVPDFALVRVVGCLTQGPGTAWTLADAGEPIRTKDPAASADGRTATAAGGGIGNAGIPAPERVPRTGSVRGSQSGSERIPDQRPRWEPHQRHIGAHPRAAMCGVR